MTDLEIICSVLREFGWHTMVDRIEERKKYEDTVTVTHRCISEHTYGGLYDKQFPCSGFRTADDKFYNTCDEPCRWVMKKTGEGDPPWKDNEE